MFMPGKKQYLKKVGEIVAAAEQQLDAHRRTFAEIGNMKDAGERYAALDRLQKTLSASLPEAPSLPGWVTKTHTGVMVLGMAAMISVIPAGSGVLGAYLFCSGFPSSFAAMWSLKKLDSKSEEIFAQEIKGVAKAARDLIKEVASTKQKVLDQELPGIAASGKFKFLYENFHEVEKAFTMAAAREKVLGERPAILTLDKKAYPLRPNDQGPDTTPPNSGSSPGGHVPSP